jgi:peptidoglycan glycosyltransferase/penicillin-binding protein 2
MLAYDMGSIFKIVVTAAALENNLIDLNKLYYCKGSLNVSGKKFDCHNVYGHGWQTITDAFKNSCNCVFIELGKEIGYKNILEMAKKFCLGRKNLNPLELEQQKGMLPDANNYYLADLANLSIGQGKLSGTVLDGAIISAVIASGGQVKSVNCVEGITDSYGQKIKSLKIENKKQIISEKTAEIIKNMMYATNQSGTGTNARLDNYSSGGKTGSAQTGWYVDGENYQHGWFTGFFPVDKPRFALCVFVENGKSGSESAAPIFSKIGNAIMNEERNFEYEH